MGEKVQPAFGSSTYDWAMRKGPGKYTADEWIDHLTTSRKVKFKVFGQPSSSFERGPKKFTYDKGSRFAGKKQTLTKKNCLILMLQSLMKVENSTGGLLCCC